jgi:transcriptional regulator with XRE-family HTH domain
MREDAGLTQRELGDLLKEPQSWVHNCETANRRVDISEFVLWAKACGVDPAKAFTEYLKKSGI